MFWPLWYWAAGADRADRDAQDSRSDLARRGGARRGGVLRRVRVDRRSPETVPDAGRLVRGGRARRTCSARAFRTAVLHTVGAALAVAGPVRHRRLCAG